ncbi:MAG TPA: phenylalanine--tRNA ligase subunit beta [Solirubrobacteraceae bacterium]|nr:phenylalanine--tRNA ligase subunit beta [Solirubrobacteraceae bacterium]
MRVPLLWLREYCDPELDVREIEERLTMTGTKVEAIHHHGVGATEHFLVGKVLAVQPHPDADRLRVCEVDLGPATPDGPATIVCGAPNVAAGQTVAVACPGAIMPDGTKLKRAKLRGVASAGMILAEDELQIGSDHAGIMVLEAGAPDDGSGLSGAAAQVGAPGPGNGVGRLTPGMPLADVLPIATDVLELEITPNRPDCLGVYGVARELHAATGAPLAPEPWTEDAGTPGPIAGAEGTPGPIEVAVECPELCARFTARVFENVKVGPSPSWLKARLSAAGQRPINNVVDITNYAMLLTGQPLHAFDLDRVAGGRLTVRAAHAGETVETLDGQTRTLDERMVVIEDADGPTSIAGVMGGARSEVQPDTSRVLLEVANWSGPMIHHTSWTLAVRSEASARFEKGLAPEQCMHAQAVATQLLIELCGARVLPGTLDVGAPPAAPQLIRLREQRVQAILGTPIARERQAEILQALAFDTAPAGDGLDVTVPALRRADVTREADLIEEVARIDGLDKLPATLPKRRGAYGRLTFAQRARRRAVDALAGRGLHEVVGWTFAAPGVVDRLRLPAQDERRHEVRIENPLSEEQSLLRTTLIGSLLDVAARNIARGMGDLRLFEVGTVFRRAPAAGTRAPGARTTGVDEQRSLAVLLAGSAMPATWRDAQPPSVDLFAVKAVLESLADALRVRDLRLAPAPQPFLHPGRSAAIVLGDLEIGWLGELHPLVAEAWELPNVACLELNLDMLIEHASQPLYRDLIGYPPLRQDLAVVLPESVAAQVVLDAARAAGGKLLDAVSVFDVYTGPQVGDGRRSLALALVFRAPDRTLTEDDVAPLRERIVLALGELGGELRG